MTLKSLELSGFKSFSKKSVLQFSTPISSIVGPNGSGKSNVAEAFRFVLGEQSIKSMRGKRGEDLIFNGGKLLPRGNRASVKVTFDNHNRQFATDFDEITIERVVHRDSSNEYFINGSQVRLKDIIELLAQASIGSSGHHIISQGEADRILSASISERREMIEDALGLNVFQYKKEEGIRKLEKTRENMERVESLLRELAPHVRFLKKQVEKIEKANELRVTLLNGFHTYLRAEEARISHIKKGIDHDEKKPLEDLHRINTEIAKLETELKKDDVRREDQEKIKLLSQNLQEVRTQKNNISREVGKLDGECSYLERERERKHRQSEKVDDTPIQLSAVTEWSQTISASIDAALTQNTLEGLRETLQNIRNSFKEFIAGHGTVNHQAAEIEVLTLEINKLKEAKQKMDGEVALLEKNEKELNQTLVNLQQEIDSSKDNKIAAERDVLKLMTEKNSVQGLLSEIMMRKDHNDSDRTLFERDLAEASALLGHEVLQFRNKKQEGETETVMADRDAQMEKRRELERMKIKLEETGVTNMGEVLKEHKDAEERDSFLRRELGDLELSSASLISLISELEETIDQKFREGIAKINDKFETFFVGMFGGGKAGLVLVKEQKRKKAADDEEELLTQTGSPDASAEASEKIKEGIDISVDLPHKKTKGLMMLSGGERALTSIALLFAMSQVNPPPFIILDETDAALDEANSRKYGDMIEALSAYSQLILITHNRETMSRAGVIYGITMSAEGASQMLSIAFEQAVTVAK